MNKQLLLSAIASLALGLSGCAGGTDDDNNTGPGGPAGGGGDGAGDGTTGDGGGDGGGDDDGGDGGDGGSDDGGDGSTGGDDGGDGGSDDGGDGGDDGGTGGGDTGTGTGSGGGFIEDPDGGAGSIECDIWTQDCDDGEKCMPWANDGGSSWNSTKCTPIDENPKQPGDECTVEGNGVSGIDDCIEGAMCWEVDPETNMGTCVQMCEGSESAPECPADTNCIIANEGVLILCLPNCDPLLQDCPGNNTCILNTSQDGFVCVIDASGDDGDVGDACEYANACSPGLMCGNADALPDCTGSLGCCTPFCDLDSPDCSAISGTECTSLWQEGMEPPDYGNVGMCTTPQ